MLRLELTSVYIFVFSYEIRIPYTIFILALSIDCLFVGILEGILECFCVS